MFERCEKKRSELPFLAIHGAQLIFLEQTSEEFLREVLRVRHFVAFAADVSVKRIPIRAAKFGEGLCRTGRRLLRCQHRTPVRGSELTGAARTERMRV